MRQKKQPLSIDFRQCIMLPILCILICCLAMLSEQAHALGTNYMQDVLSPASAMYLEIF
ncbi:hypothetical protein [Alteromonas ponticola]|uniref:Uncharacterized protein n=1 Tax=Alteromonas ponticola TaxID=2720613 RepID=A0ABX1R353_9ALTE|nr:hypothetical protein [Alteromonas ponticola]NMH60869.1 hypothetical protein [Alteromonas ponticola]